MVLSILLYVDVLLRNYLLSTHPDFLTDFGVMLPFTYLITTYLLTY